MVRPLAEQLEQRGVAVDLVVGREATKERLRGLLPRNLPATLTITATHGVAFPPGDDRQRQDQGALLCADWTRQDGDRTPIAAAAYFGSDDLPQGADLAGSMFIHASSYGAGTSQSDRMLSEMLGAEAASAPQSFTAALAQRLLAHPGGGALAVIGAVERVWGPGVGDGNALSPSPYLQSWRGRSWTAGAPGRQ